jgi:hypothetical protein
MTVTPLWDAGDSRRDAVPSLTWVDRQSSTIHRAYYYRYLIST